MSCLFLLFLLYPTNKCNHSIITYPNPIYLRLRVNVLGGLVLSMSILYRYLLNVFLIDIYEVLLFGTPAENKR